MTDDSRGWQWTRIAKAKIAQNQRDNGGRCERGYHGCLGQATEVNHRIERINGGTDHPSNLEALCAACHTRLTTALVQSRATMRRMAKIEARRRNHPGRRDRHE